MKDPYYTCTRELPAMRTGRPSSHSHSEHSSLQWVNDLGYVLPREFESVGVCGVRGMLFTGAVVVGIGPERYAGRYCYGTMGAAIAALAAWDGQGDPPGEWIKYKGDAGERLGPGCAVDLVN